MQSKFIYQLMLGDRLLIFLYGMTLMMMCHRYLLDLLLNWHLVMLLEKKTEGIYYIWEAIKWIKRIKNQILLRKEPC